MRLKQPSETAFLGVLVLDTKFPRPPGDIGNPETYLRAGIPVQMLTVRGASVHRVVREQDPTLLEPFANAARQLEAKGARLITTSCGFLACWQQALQASVTVPVITSSLLQCSSLYKPGIITFDAESLHPSFLQRAGVPEGTPFAGLQPGCELQRRIWSDDTTLDLKKAEADVVRAAQSLVAQHPDVVHIVLECTNMPPYREAVSRATGRLVYDLETLLLSTW